MLVQWQLFSILKMSSRGWKNILISNRPVATGYFFLLCQCKQVSCVMEDIEERLF